MINWIHNWVPKPVYRPWCRPWKLSRCSPVRFEEQFFLKLVFAIFYQIFIFHQIIALSIQNYEKCFFFHLKSFFCSRDIQIFVFSSSTIFLPVSHCCRGWSKINLEIYDVINLFDILRRKEGMTLKLYPVIGY